MVPWYIIIGAFIPMCVPFLVALIWPSRKARQKKISKEQPFSWPVLKSLPFSSYEQGYQVQTPPQSVKPFPFIRRNVAEPKQDPPGALYEQPQTQYSERDVPLS
jgi:hypothetical protein